MQKQSSVWAWATVCIFELLSVTHVILHSLHSSNPRPWWRGKRKHSILFIAANPVSGWRIVTYKAEAHRPLQTFKHLIAARAVKGERWGILQLTGTSCSFFLLLWISGWNWRTDIAALFCLTREEFHAVICATFYSPRPRWRSRWLIMITMFSFYLALTSQCPDKLLFF